MMLVVAFSPGIPAFTQPEESRQALAEGVAEEVAAPPSVAPGAWSSLQKLSDLYMSGAPSNNLTEVGLIFHGFDGTEKGWPTNDVWHPCTEGWCQGATDHWSASIVSHQHKAVFSDAGILYAPNLNTVMCSVWSDIGSLGAGCSSPVSDGWEGSTFPEDRLKDMLDRSFTDPALEFVYNEVLIDSQKFVQNLPGSVGAFVFGMTGKSAQGAQMQATAAYVNFLDAYKLTEADVPLLQLHHTGPQALTDESAGARKYVEDHPHAYQTWLKTWTAEHPGMSGVPLDEIPEQLPGVLRSEAEALAKTKTARVAKKEAPALAPKGHKAEKKAPRTDEEKVAMAEEKAAKAEEKAAKAEEKAAKAAAAVDEEKAAKAAKKADEERAAKTAKKADEEKAANEPVWWRTDCKAIAGTQVRDAWCAKNCGSSIPFCPIDQCECEGGNPIAYTDNMTAPSQGAKVILQCKAVEDDRNIDVNDAWCMTSCNPKAGAPPNCPTKACKCEGGNPTAGGMPAHLTPEAVEQWKENEEKKKHAQSEANKRKQADILAAQEAKKVAARDAAVAAAAQRDADREEERQRVEAERQEAAAAAAQANARANGLTPAPVRDERLPTATHAPPDRELTEAEEKAQKEIEDSQKAIEAAHRAAQQAQQAQQEDGPSLPEPVTAAPPRELTDDEIEAQRVRDEAQKEREDGQKAIDAAHKATQQAAEEIRQQTAADAEQKEAERIQAEKDRLADPEQQAEEAEEANEAEEAGEEAAERLVKDEAAHSRGDGHKWHKPKSAQPEAHHRGDGHKWHEAEPED